MKENELIVIEENEYQMEKKKSNKMNDRWKQKEFEKMKIHLDKTKIRIYNISRTRFCRRFPK